MTQCIIKRTGFQATSEELITISIVARRDESKNEIMMLFTNQVLLGERKLGQGT